MEVSKSMPRTDFGRTVFVHWEPSLTSGSHTAEQRENPPRPSERNFPPGPDSLQLDTWPWPTSCVQDNTEHACVSGPLFSAYETHSREVDNTPMAGKMRSFVSGLLRHTHHFPDQRQRGCIQGLMRFIMLLYI